jgi:hypothetical protein
MTRVNGFSLRQNDEVRLLSFWAAIPPAFRASSASPTDPEVASFLGSHHTAAVFG